MGKCLGLVSIVVKGVRGVSELGSEVGEILQDSLNAVVELGDFPMEGNNFLLQQRSLVSWGPFQGGKGAIGQFRFSCLGSGLGSGSVIYVCEHSGHASVWCLIKYSTYCDGIGNSDNLQQRLIEWKLRGMKRGS